MFLFAFKEPKSKVFDAVAPEAISSSSLSPESLLQPSALSLSKVSRKSVVPPAIMSAVLTLILKMELTGDVESSFPSSTFTLNVPVVAEDPSCTNDTCPAAS